MIEPKRSRPSTRPSGVTLVELTVAMTITAIVALLATQTYVSFVRDNATRRKVTDVQGGTRFALEVLGREFRHASLGAGTGRIWIASGGNPAARPAVQIFQDIEGKGTLDLAGTVPGAASVKGSTDALLVVEAMGSERAATEPPGGGDLTSVTPGMPRSFTVTATSNWTGDSRDDTRVEHTLDAGEPILIGDYRDASWGVIEEVNAAAQITVTSDLALPGGQIQRLPAGAKVRRARARLYYVDALDQLVRLELAVPRAPAAAAEITGGEVLATGIENLQLGCEVNTGTPATGALTPCVGTLGAGHEITTESAGAFDFATGGGPMLQADDASGAGAVSNLRTVVLNVVARSATPLASAAGDPRIELDGVTLGDDTQAYVRRSYRLALGVRNTSLGDL